MDEIVEPATLLTIVANGQPRNIQSGLTVDDFLRELGIMPARVVVQLDGVIVPRAEFALMNLHDGSRLEIITLVGGG